jgi:alpha-beta hydrolase superfamily lysophospholipase
MAAAFRDIGWRVEAPTLCPQLRVKANPPADLPKLTLADYVAEMEAAARRLEAETGRPPVAFGHSLGGVIALKLAERGVIRAAVLLAPSPPAGVQFPPSLWPLFTFASVLFTPNMANKAVKIWETGFRSGMLNCVPRSRHAEIYAATRYDSGLVVRDLGQHHKDPQRIAAIDATRIAVPVLTVGGAKDRAVPIDVQRKIAAKYKGAGGDYLEYADNGHWIVDEPGTERVIADVASWLETKAAR